MPCSTHSTASVLVMCSTAAFDVLYAVWRCGRLTMDAEIDAMLTMEPGSPLAISRRATARAIRKTPSTFTAIMRFQSPKSRSRAPPFMLMPALLNSTFGVPSAVTMASSARSTPVSSATSQAKPPARTPYAPAISDATCSQSSRCLLITATSAPADAKCSATARPMPLVPPVMTASLPRSENLPTASTMSRPSRIPCYTLLFSALKVSRVRLRRANASGPRAMLIIENSASTVHICEMRAFIASAISVVSSVRVRIATSE